MSPTSLPRGLRWVVVLGLVLGLLGMHHLGGGLHSEHAMGAVTAPTAGGDAMGAMAAVGAAHAAGADPAPGAGSQPATWTAAATTGSGHLPALLCLAVLSAGLALLLNRTAGGAQIAPRLAAAVVRPRPLPRARAGPAVLLEKCVLRT